MQRWKEGIWVQTPRRSLLIAFFHKAIAFATRRTLPIAFFHKAIVFSTRRSLPIAFFHKAIAAIGHKHEAIVVHNRQLTKAIDRRNNRSLRTSNRSLQTSNRFSPGHFASFRRRSLPIGIFGADRRFSDIEVLISSRFHLVMQPGFHPSSEICDGSITFPTK